MSWLADGIGVDSVEVCLEMDAMVNVWEWNWDSGGSSVQVSTSNMSQS